MTDEDRERFEPGTSPDDAGDPAAAFEALRRTVEAQGKQLNTEMTIIRKGVELALEQSERFRQPPDYGPDLGRMIQYLAIVDERLEAVEQSPILRNGPEHYARALERSGESLVRTAAQQFQHESRDFQSTARNLANHIAGARERHVQNRLLWIVGVAGIVSGILLTLFLPAMLPGSAAPRVASFVMAERPWQAGMILMQFANPEAWIGLSMPISSLGPTRPSWLPAARRPAAPARCRTARSRCQHRRRRSSVELSRGSGFFGVTTRK